MILKEQPTIVAATESPRRLLFLASIPAIKLLVYGGGEELATNDVIQVAVGKAISAREQLRSEQILNGQLIVGADIRTEILTPKGFVSRGKPKDGEHLVWENFAQMSLVDGKLGYRLVAGSAVDHEGKMTKSFSLCRVFIKKEGMIYLSSLRGFEEYKAAYLDFYSSPPYSSQNLRPIGLRDVSGGISLPVLVSMGLVEGISFDGVNMIDLSRESLMRAIFIAGVGYGPAVLEKLDPNYLEIIKAWDWLNQVTNKILFKK